METGEPVIIWGAGGHAEVVSDIVELEARYRIAGFPDDAHSDRWGTSFCWAGRAAGSGGSSLPSGTGGPGCPRA